MIIGGEGRAFCAGADLKERRTLNKQQIRRNVSKTREVFSALERLPQPTIAAINGYAFGGGMELALCCDFRYSLREAQMGLTEVSLGIIPGAGGTQRLPRLIGPSKAKELILTARKMSAEQAYELGLLNVIAENLEQLKERSEKLPLKFSPKLRLLSIKQRLRLIGAWTPTCNRGWIWNSKPMKLSLTTKDRLEALEAFREKRAPHFTGE